jgi:hypothetical protein
MALTWSISRDQMLHSCERRYYFQYIIKAKTNSRDQTFREIAFLKKLKNIPMWKGDIFHSVVADYLMRIRQDLHPVSSELLNEAEERMKQEWTFSASKRFEMDPRMIGQDGGLALFEHVYDEDLAERDPEDAIKEVEGSLVRFFHWVEKNDLSRHLREAKQVWLEPRTYGVHAPGFKVDDVQVLAKVDLAFVTPAGEFKIFDWKTGLPSSRPSRQIDRSEFQVSVYQLWPHLTLQYPLNKITGYLVYVSADPVSGDAFEIDENIREHTLSVVRRSISRVKHFSDSHGGEKLTLENFNFAGYDFICQRCSFKRLCQRTLEDE